MNSTLVDWRLSRMLRVQRGLFGLEAVDRLEALERSVGIPCLDGGLEIESESIGSGNIPRLMFKGGLTPRFEGGVKPIGGAKLFLGVDSRCL